VGFKIPIFEDCCRFGQVAGSSKIPCSIEIHAFCITGKMGFVPVVSQI
jgi:hypothetical protein